jgi:hypothetical protein
LKNKRRKRQIEVNRENLYTIEEDFVAKVCVVGMPSCKQGVMSDMLGKHRSATGATCYSS